MAPCVHTHIKQCVKVLCMCNSILEPIAEVLYIVVYGSNNGGCGKLGRVKRRA